MLSSAKVDYIILNKKICFFLYIKYAAYLHLQGLPKPSKYLHNVVFEQVLGGSKTVGKRLGTSDLTYL
jgi:hypothetical protein